jgi:restriction system protein
LEEFIADLLKAMGYRTTISPQGGDSGIDIVAYKDELPPRIAVQVKSQDSDIKETTSHDHHFKWWFEISPIRANYLHA